MPPQNFGNAAIDQKEGRLPSPPPSANGRTNEAKGHLPQNRMQSFANNFD
jgi:hypothetical protein